MNRLAFLLVLLTMVLATWAIRAQDVAESQLQRGASVFEYWCATCHGDGPGMPGTDALRAKYNGTLPALLVERSDLTPELIEFYVRNGISVMPHFRKTEIGDADLDALAEYIVTRARESN